MRTPWIFCWIALASAPLCAAPPLACGDTVAADVSLSSDLHCTTGTGGWGSPVLEVVADGVTIDLNGHTLSGPAGLDGIAVKGRSKVAIRNGTIKGFRTGIDSFDTSGLNVDRVSFFNLKNGLLIRSGSRAAVTRNQFIRIDEYAVRIANAHAGRVARENRVEGNEFYDTLSGITICGHGTGNNLLRKNFIWKSRWFGILVDDSRDNRILGNEILETSGSAIRMDNALSNELQDNVLRVGSIGLEINGRPGPGGCLYSGRTTSSYNRFNFNYAMEFSTGIFADGADGGAVSRNEFRINKLYDNGIGLYLDAGTSYNDASGNGYWGSTTPVRDFGVGNIH